jgi:hypothetical protein
MKVFLLCCFMLFSALPVLPADKESLLAELKAEIAKKDGYDKAKQARIHQLMQKRTQASPINYAAQYDLCLKLYDEYKSYQYDSAYVYVNKLKSLSINMNDMSRAYYSQIKLGFILLSSGMFKETFDCMRRVNPKLLNDSMKVEYYFIMYRCNSDLAKYNSDKYFSPDYLRASNAYIDSAIKLSKIGSVNRIYFSGLRHVGANDNYNGSQELGKLVGPGVPISMHLRAMITCSLGQTYINSNRRDEGIAFLIHSAIADIKSSTKETVALFTLAEQLYKTGNIKDAYSFIQLAKADADFYGARQRKIQIGAILPLVAAEELNHTESEKNRILMYLLGHHRLASLVILFLIMI